MARKKGNPGCPCCCTPETISASSPDKWINVDNEWSDAGDYWTTTTTGAILLGSRKLNAAASQKVVITLRVPDNDTVRFVFYYIDTDNYYCLQWDRSANVFSLIRREAASETVIKTYVVLDYAFDPMSVVFTLCFNACDVRFRFATGGPTGGLISTFGYPDLVADGYYSQCPTNPNTYVGVIAQSASDTIYVNSIQYLCDEACQSMCVCVDEWGPSQFQCVLSGFTGGCSFLNGTYILDHTYMAFHFGYHNGCLWRYDNPSPSDPSVLTITCRLYYNSVTKWTIELLVGHYVSGYTTFFQCIKTSLTLWDCLSLSNLDLGSPTTVGTSSCRSDVGHAYLTSL